MNVRSLALRPLTRTSTTTSISKVRYLRRGVSQSVIRYNFRPQRVGAAAACNHLYITKEGGRRAYSTPMAAPTDTAAAEVANNTGITPDTLAQTLREKLEATHVDIQDISGGCGASFTALIVSAQFQGKAALARHRLVNSALKAEIAAIHAWTPKCLTPEQWEQQQKQQQQQQ